MDNYLMFNGVKYTLTEVVEESAPAAVEETPAVETTTVEEPTTTQEAVVESSVNTEDEPVQTPSETV
ncbi:MAG: hypothetical protein C5B43_04125 [Verrucomicrobia bacterium]|nr:MAG: hypothetical protein C5B43_04125 [Verrucomicrobiota bacterium]